MNLTTRTPLAAVVLLATLISFAAFLAHSPMPSAPDMERHVRHTRELSFAFADSLSYPDWDPAPFHGRGGPYYRFIAPLPLAIAVFLTFFGLEPYVALKLCLLLAALLGASGIYLLFKDRNSTRGALIALLLFLAHPFLTVLLNHMFVFQNIFAILVLPWVWVGLLRIFAGRKFGWQILSAAMGIILLSHLLTALLTGYSLIIACIIYRLLDAKHDFGPLIKVGLSIVLALAFASPYILPAMATRGETDASQLTGRYVDIFDDHFIDQQPLAGPIDSFRLAFSFMDNKLRGLAADTNLKRIDDLNPFIRMNVLKPWTAITTIVLVLCGLLTLWRGKPEKDEKTLVITGLILMFLYISWSKFIWNALPGLKVLQLPWRCVLPASFLIIAGSARYLYQAASKNKAGMFTLLVIAWLIPTFVISAVSITYPKEDIERIAYQKTGLQPFTPLSIPDRYPDIADIAYWGGEHHQAFSYPSKRLIQPFERGFEWARFAFNNENSDIRFYINTHFDNLWRLKLNGTKISPELNKQTGTMYIDIKPGNNSIELYRLTPPWRNLGWLLAFISSAIWIFLTAKTKKLT